MQRVVGTKEHSSPGGCVPALELSREEKGSRSQNVCYWPWLVRVPSSNHSSRPFLARGRCNRTLRHFCQKCIVHSVCNLRPSPSRHRHRIASYRIASPASRSEFYASPRPSKNISLCNNEIITFVTFARMRGVSRRDRPLSPDRENQYGIGVRTDKVCFNVGALMVLRVIRVWNYNFSNYTLSTLHTFYKTYK